MNQPFGFEQPEDSPGFLLWQTTITWQRQIKKELDRFKISHAQFVILAVSLWLGSKNQDVTQSLIVKLSKLDKMTVSKSLKKLTSLNLVKRSEHEHDTRVKQIFLTKKGIELTGKMVPIVEKVDAKFFGTLPKSNQNKLIDLLKNLIDSVE